MWSNSRRSSSGNENSFLVDDGFKGRQEDRWESYISFLTSQLHKGRIKRFPRRTTSYIREQVSTAFSNHFSLRLFSSSSNPIVLSCLAYTSFNIPRFDRSWQFEPLSKGDETYMERPF